MTKLIISIFLGMVLFSIAACVFATEYSLSMFQRSAIADSDQYSVGSWAGMQFSYAPNDKGYFFISQETAQAAPSGHAFDYNMTGLGVGNKYQLTKDIRLFGQFGYYIIKNTQGRQRAMNENLYYYLNKYYHVSPGMFDEYEVKNENAIGGTIGLELNYPISKHWSANFIYSYRILKVNEDIRGMKDVWDYDHTGQCWMVGKNRNYSSTNMGLSINYKF
jgi:outer membrane scaffolding protein for murein synthesis (MipA/OmpV family)